MEKKRSIGVSLLCLYLLLSAVVGSVSYDASSIILEIINIIFALASLICAVALFKLFPWGRKATIILMVGGIVYSLIYHSPLMKEVRIEERLKFYDQLPKNDDSKLYINNKEVTQDEYIDHRNQYIEDMKSREFDFKYMIPIILIQGLIIFFLAISEFLNIQLVSNHL